MNHLGWRAPVHAAVLFLLVLAPAWATASGPSLPPARRAELYRRWAEEALAGGTVEARLRAARDLEQAIALEPANAENWILLGRVRLHGGYHDAARACFQRALALGAGKRALLEIGLTWKREWLQNLDSLALARAITELRRATVVAPRAIEAWLHLVPLLCEGADLEGAAEAAARAMEARPRHPEALLAAAYVAFWRNETERADSLFRAALPRLDRNLWQLLRDPAGLLADQAASLEPTAEERPDVPPPPPWQRLDPDPTTPENELQLEYWSRVCHAALLFYDPLRPVFDFRGETYIRYGRPQRIDYNPLGAALETRTLHGRLQGSMPGMVGPGGSSWRPPVEFPVNVQRWHYPDLGMQVTMQDRSLRGLFEPEAREDFDPASRPDAGLLATRDDVLMMGGGFAVFPKLPPRDRRLDVSGILARFEDQRGPRLLIQVESPGAPTDTLTARWVVTDLSGRAVAQGAGNLRLSGCDPAERREAQFLADLRAGTYQVAVSVRDRRQRRGLFQTRASVPPPDSELGLSDLVLVCGQPGFGGRGPGVWFDANMTARVAGPGPLLAYLEIYRMAPDSSGQSRFEVAYEVRSTAPEKKRRRRDGEPPALISASRDEVHMGPLRRQFVSVPVQSLPAGRYRLSVRVRDLVAASTAERTLEFERP